jgi:hypothetical protein
MSNEATVRNSLQIKTGNLDYRPQPTQFTLDAADDIGPTPGAMLATTTGLGVEVDLSVITAAGAVPGLCRVHNLDDTNYVELGIYDGVEFNPLLEIGPGEFYPFKLSRDLFYGGAGTAVVNQLRVRADTASCRVIVDVFGRTL